MSERVGYIGKYKGHRVFFTGEFYYAVINGLNMVIDEKKVDEDMQRLA